ncbi:MAG: SRPBCC family protein [Balneolaceae bacterium]|nr:SRPBCC family protein [Balneolaceae bacterium]MBO6545581.1 SRPBCC family protein [Balneolaceae bacterium]MBO6646977.1 SRPBCC family protein [Balneolaceae bacterium]
MPAFHVSRNIIIEASPEKVFSTLNNLSTWVNWSPWLIMEPEANVTIADDNKYYEWEGSRVGAGSMKITGEEENSSVDYDLNFLKPWKSEAKVRFMIDGKGDQTKVTWSMDSSLPWYMFWMVGMMDSWIGMDYERGLGMLKEYVEEGEIKSKLEWKGESQFPGTKYIGIKTTCGMDEIGEVMMGDFGKIEAFMKEHEDIATGNAYSIYHKWDMKKQQTIYTGCVGVNQVPDDLPADFVSGEIPATKIYTLRHIGKYDHLGNAWSTMMSMGRNKEFKQKRGIHPWEYYVTNPQETAESDHITDVCFAVK